MISIIIPTYNRANLLERAVDSILKQTYNNWELLIVDDGSIDNTKDTVNKYLNDKRIKYIYQENKGQGAARNLGIKNSNGDYIAFLDSDDKWSEEKLQKQTEAFGKYPDIDFCFTADIINTENKIIVEKRYENKTNLPFYKLSGIGISVPSSHVYKKTSFTKIGNFDENRDLIGLEDNEWSIRGYNLKGYYIDEPLTEYFMHEGQITKKNIKNQLKNSNVISLKL